MQIQEIRTELLTHHPDNPRSDFGDIDELTESIREKGILQPLTVVKCGVKYYNVIAGNRRLEAAKKAELATCPCIVSDMNEKEQAAVMLIENMQRKNLTPYEEGKGVQLCLDLGISEADLAKKTGFSKETIRHRKKLAELDQKKLKEKCKDGQISMNDLVKLEKIKDPEMKNRILDSIGTRDFDYSLERTIRDQEIKEMLTKARLKLETFAEEQNSDWHDSNYVMITNYIANDEFDIPEDSDERQYVFKCPSYSTSSYQLWAEKIDTDDDDDDAQVAAVPDPHTVACEKLKEEQAIFREMHKEFMKTEADDLPEESLLKWLLWAWLDDDDICEENDFEGIYMSGADTKLYEEISRHEYSNILNESGNRFRHEATLMLYSALELQPYHKMYHGYKGEWVNDESADMLYKFLGEVGYVMSENEKKMQAGTHEYFYEEDTDE